MTSSRDKGAEAIREAMKLWKAQKWLCWKPGNRALYIKGRFVSASQDIFEKFDFIALKKAHKARLVQGTFISGSTSNAQARMKKIDAIIDFIPLEHVMPTVVARVHGKKGVFRTWQIEENGKWKELVYDDEMPWIPEIVLED